MVPRPLKIVHLSDDGSGQFVINTEAFNSVLDKVGDLPFVLYSINGRTRDGKSYVLNQLLRYLSHRKSTATEDDDGAWFHEPLTEEFLSSNGSDRVTVGMYLWSEPFFDIQDGKEVAILLMDCQGLFDDQTTPQQNAVIFSLSNLLSSVMIFNVMKMVDEMTFQQLHFYSEYTQAVASDEDDVDQFQKLVILIRDFQYRDYPFGYHDDCTCPSTGAPNSTKNFYQKTMNDRKVVPENMAVRNRLRTFFANIAMFLLPYPGTPFVESGGSTPPDPIFETNLKAFIHLMTSKDQAQLKKIAGKTVTASDFKIVVQNWARRCRECASQFPPVSDMRETAIKVTLAMSVSKAFALFQDRFDQFMNGGGEKNRGVTDEQFVNQYKIILEEAVGVFRASPKIGGESVHAAYIEELKKDCKALYLKNKTINSTQREMAEARQKFLEQQAEGERRLERLGKEMQELAEAAREAEVQFLAQMKSAQEEKKALEERQKVMEKSWREEKTLLEDQQRRSEAQFLRECEALRVEQAAREAAFQEEKRRLEAERRAREEELRAQMEVQLQKQREMEEAHRQEMLAAEQRAAAAARSSKKRGWVAFRDKIVNPVIERAVGGLLNSTADFLINKFSFSR